jgi:NAD-dependent SIR2 family protein deacetylase
MPVATESDFLVIRCLVCSGNYNVYRIEDLREPSICPACSRALKPTTFGQIVHVGWQLLAGAAVILGSALVLSQIWKWWTR